MHFENAFGGLFGLILLVLVLVAIVKTVRSSANNGEKLLWVLVLLLIPVIGLIVWFLVGPE